MSLRQGIIDAVGVFSCAMVFYGTYGYDPRAAFIAGGVIGLCFSIKASEPKQ